jgi:hypothetical protein
LNRRIQSARAESIQSRGQYLAVEDSKTNVIYSFDIAGTYGFAKGKTKLTGANGRQFWIQGAAVIEGESTNGAVGFWNYPAGGEPTKTITGPTTTIVGATVSLASSR